MIDTSEQVTLMDINLCNTCKSYRCAHVIEMTKEYGSEPLVKKCDGYNNKSRSNKI